MLKLMFCLEKNAKIDVEDFRIDDPCGINFVSSWFPIIFSNEFCLHTEVLLII